ncbi:NaeI family type II restriction endonuclease [Microbacterium lacusdiani]
MTLFDLTVDPPTGDRELDAVCDALRGADPNGTRFGRVLRSTFDQLYDGQHTGRYSWQQLHKTERTHFGTLVEINLRREFDDVIDDGDKLDYAIAGTDVDCKYSQTFGGWMIPPEAFERILLVVHANDAAAEFAVGVIRARPDFLRASRNRDNKTSLNPLGRAAIRWLHRPGELPPNVLLQADPADIEAIFAKASGQQKVNELFRRIQRRRIGRNAVATVAQQDDYMKRVRANGGARSALQREGYLILGGDYAGQRAIARDLGIDVPMPGEMVSVQVARARDDEVNTALIDGALWRVADPRFDRVMAAPVVPHG